MDDMLEKSRDSVRLDNRGRDGAAASEGRTFLGGMPDQLVSNLTGCISNVFIKRCHVSPFLFSSPLPSSLLLSSEGDSVFHFWLCSSGKPIHRWFSTCWRQRRTLMCLSTVLLPKNLSRSSALNPNTINKRFLHWNTQSSQSTQKNWNTVIVTHGDSWTLLPHKGSGVPAIEWMNPMCLLDAQISSNPKTKMEITPNQYTGMRSPRRWLFIWSSKDLSQTDLKKLPKNWNSSSQD